MTDNDSRWAAPTQRRAAGAGVDTPLAARLVAPVGYNQPGPAGGGWDSGGVRTADQRAWDGAMALAVGPARQPRKSPPPPRSARPAT